MKQTTTYTKKKAENLEYGDVIHYPSKGYLKENFFKVEKVVEKSGSEVYVAMRWFVRGVPSNHISYRTFNKSTELEVSI